jgi:hypothetical protein
MKIEYKHILEDMVDQLLSPLGSSNLLDKLIIIIRHQGSNNQKDNHRYLFIHFVMNMFYQVGSLHNLFQVKH